MTEEEKQAILTSDDALNAWVKEIFKYEKQLPPVTRAVTYGDENWTLYDVRREFDEFQYVKDSRRPVVMKGGRRVLQGRWKNQSGYGLEVVNRFLRRRPDAVRILNAIERTRRRTWEWRAAHKSEQKLLDALHDHFEKRNVYTHRNFSERVHEIASRLVARDDYRRVPSVQVKSVFYRECKACAAPVSGRRKYCSVVCQGNANSRLRLAEKAALIALREMGINIGELNA